MKSVKSVAVVILSVFIAVCSKNREPDISYLSLNVFVIEDGGAEQNVLELIVEDMRVEGYGDPRTGSTGLALRINLVESSKWEFNELIRKNKGYKEFAIRAGGIPLIKAHFVTPMPAIYVEVESRREAKKLKSRLVRNM